MYLENNRFRNTTPSSRTRWTCKRSATDWEKETIIEARRPCLRICIWWWGTLGLFVLEFKFINFVFLFCFFVCRFGTAVSLMKKDLPMLNAQSCWTSSSTNYSTRKTRHRRLRHLRHLLETRVQLEWEFPRSGVMGILFYLLNITCIQILEFVWHGYSVLFRWAQGNFPIPSTYCWHIRWCICVSSTEGLCSCSKGNE